MRVVTMKKVPAWVILCVIALVAGAALGTTNALTKGPIAEQAAKAAEEARAAVLPAAASFEPITLEEGAAVDYCYQGVDGGSGFSETAGLGAKVKDASFTEQFAGLVAPVALVKDGGEVDSVTAASISSNAVCSAVNTAAEFIAGLA